MSQDPAVLSAGAVALSNSATLAALMIHLKGLGLLTEEIEREIYEDALMLLEDGQEDDESGVFEAARELIEQHLRR